MHRNQKNETLASTAARTIRIQYYHFQVQPGIATSCRLEDARILAAVPDIVDLSIFCAPKLENISKK
jgi:hypothetical protein